MTTASDLRMGLFVNGKEQACDETISIVNPARPSEVVGYAASATIQDVNAAIEAASAAQPAWGALSVSERAAFLIKIADELNQDEAETNARTRLFTQEHGKTLFETTIEINRLADRFRQVAGFAERLAKEEEISGPAFDTIVTRKARGVCVQIVPWNWPLAILGSKLPQALLAGNCVVIKLSEFSSLAPAQTIMKLARLLPDGVVNLITGDGVVLGDRLVSHELVSHVNFTGSTRIGRHVMQMAAINLTPVTLELGGNDAGIVLSDAVLDEAFFKKLYTSIFLTSGQICMALKRLYVHRAIYDDVIDGLSAVMAKQMIGDGLQEGTTMGPLNNAKQKKIVETMLQEAAGEGADIRHFGTLTGDEEGYFLTPSMVLGAAQSSSVIAQEQFGPTIPITAFETEAEAIALANDNDFGLSSSVWSGDDDHAIKVARQLEVGFTNLNAHGPTAMDGLSPFGGVKHSGIGRNFGYEGITQFQDYHSISGTKGRVF